MTKILGVDVRDATEVSSGMCCTLKVVPCRGILCASTIWSSSATANLPLLIFSTKTVILTLSLLTCLLQIRLFILKKISSYLLSFCPWCWWKKLPLNIHFFLLGVLPLSSPLPWLVLEEGHTENVCEDTCQLVSCKGTGEGLELKPSLSCWT